MKKEHKNEFNNFIFNEEFIKNYSKYRQHGAWVKYDAEPGNWANNNATYNKLYNDIKDLNKELEIAKSLEACEKELCGEMLPSEGIKPGDIYVFYEEINGRKLPVFYIKLSEYKDSFTKETLNYIEFNGKSIGYYGINGKYLSELILKLIEIDETKNKKYIEELKLRYAEYVMLDSFIDKENLDEDEINFIYYMAYYRKESIAIDKIKNRNLKADFESFSDSQKARLFFHIKDTDKTNELIIDSKNVLMEIAKYGCFKQLANTTEEIINDKNFVINLLKCYFEATKNNGSLAEIVKYLPHKYKDDIDVLTLIINYNPAIVIHSARWLDEKYNDNDYAYKLIASYINVFMKKEQNCYDSFMEYALYPFCDEVLNDIENHLLIGPQTNIKQEELKNNIINTLVKNKCKILNYRHANK